MQVSAFPRPRISRPNNFYIRRLRCGETERGKPETCWKRPSEPLNGYETFSSRSTPADSADTSRVVSAAEYDARAAEAHHREIIAEQHAAVRRELESRIAEGYWPGSGQNINPHHVSNTLRGLVESGEMEWVTGPTRGGAQIETLQPTDRAGRADRIDQGCRTQATALRPVSGLGVGNQATPQRFDRAGGGGGGARGHLGVRGGAADRSGS